MNGTRGMFGVVWAVVGLCGMLGFAIYRLVVRALEAFEMGLSPVQWSITVAICLFMAYSEGYRGFQLRFSPRTAARIRHLGDGPGVIHALLAPLFAMGFYHATRRTRIAAWGVTIGVIVLVTLIRFLEQPWRGIIDAGVVVGLSWGLASLAWETVKAFTRTDFAASPELPRGSIALRLAYARNHSTPAA